MLAIVALVVTIDACSGEVATARAAQDEPFEGRFECHETGTTETYVLVDHETGVQYIVGNTAHTVCPLLDTDGTPLLVAEAGE